MTKNMSGLDRTLRLTAGAVVAVLYATGAIGGVTAIVLGVVALVLLATSVVGACPAYLPFRFSTRRSS
ncbi:YgaP family membrane protein [Rubrivirga sp.]|uniref:YgaP family membrane protein n=1 Tax=Rubrivirga sp. TaxID=1885344 RepID=UPI003C76EA23